MRLVRFVSWLTDQSLGRWGTFLAIAAVLGVGSAWLASGLDIRTSFEELLPDDVPSVVNSKELKRRVGGDGTVLLMVEAVRGPRDLPLAEQLAARLAEGLLDLGPEVVRAVEVNVEPVKRWYADHWPLFLPVKDVREARDGLVKVIGREKARLNPMMNIIEEDEPGEDGSTRALDLRGHEELQDLLDPAKPSPKQRIEDGFAQYVDGYMVHPDRRSVTIVVRPTGTSLGISEVRVVLGKIRAVIDRARGEAKANHLEVGVGGSYPIMLAEFEALQRGATLAFLVVLAVLLLSFLVYLGDARFIVAIAVALLVAVAVTFGITRLAIGYLNMQTAFLSSIVAGNGSNYAVIYLGRLKQLRRRGVPLAPACHEAAAVTAGGTLLAAVGTSAAFGTLLMATNRGFRHFGFVGGIGMVLCWIATFALLPALLVLLERLRPRRVRIRPLGHEKAVAVLEPLFRRPRAIVAVFAALTVAAAVAYIWHLPNAMEHNLDNLRNDEIGSAEVRRVHARAMGGVRQSIAGAIALLPSRAAADAYCAEIDSRMRRDPRVRTLINGCETFASVVPADQSEKLTLVRDMGERLSDRVLAHLPAAQSERAREIRAQLMGQHPLSEVDAPRSLLDRFRERDGAIGRIAFVRAQPDAKLELVPRLREFAAAVRDVPVEGRRYDGAGVDIVAADLLADIERQGTRVTALSFACVCALVVVFFRTFQRSALLIASTTAGAIVMLGVTVLAQLKINFFNIAAYPVTFGIAADYGANIFSRLRVRRTVVPALVEVAPSMLMCSWASIVSYASLTVSFSPALRSFGWYAMIGELTTLTPAIVVLPAMLRLLPVHLWHAPKGEAIEEDEAVRVT